MNNEDNKIEVIKCPECGVHQEAKIINAAPFPIYAHTCTDCGYTITESEWDNVEDEKHSSQDKTKYTETENGLIVKVPQKSKEQFEKDVQQTFTNGIAKGRILPNEDKVKECEFADKDNPACIHCELHSLNDNRREYKAFCKDNPNCLFKQNLALKERNDKLQKQKDLAVEALCKIGVYQNSYNTSDGSTRGNIAAQALNKIKGI